MGLVWALSAISEAQIWPSIENERCNVSKGTVTRILFQGFEKVSLSSESWFCVGCIWLTLYRDQTNSLKDTCFRVSVSPVMTLPEHLKVHRGFCTIQSLPLRMASTLCINQVQLCNICCFIFLLYKGFAVFPLHPQINSLGTCHLIWLKIFLLKIRKINQKLKGRGNMHSFFITSI